MIPGEASTGVDALMPNSHEEKTIGFAGHDAALSP
jgi:hypothetical protein